MRQSFTDKPILSRALTRHVLRPDAYENSDDRSVSLFERTEIGRLDRGVTLRRRRGNPTKEAPSTAKGIGLPLLSWLTDKSGLRKHRFRDSSCRLRVRRLHGSGTRVRMINIIFDFVFFLHISGLLVFQSNRRSPILK